MPAPLYCSFSYPFGFSIPLTSKNLAVPAAPVSVSARPERARSKESAGGTALTGIAVPVEVVLGVAVALQVEARLLARRAVGEGDVVVGDVVEEVDLVLLEHQAGGDGVHGRVAPALVEEAAVAVEVVEVVDVGPAAQPVEVADLEVGPLAGAG